MDTSIDSEVDGIDPQADLFKDFTDVLADRNDTSNSEQSKTELSTENNSDTEKTKPVSNSASKKRVEATLECIKQLTPDVMHGLSSGQLIQLHTELNSVMMNVVIALKSKCPVSPTNSQESSQ